MVAEQGRDRTERARLVLEEEADIVLRADLARGAELDLPLGVIRDAAGVARLAVGEVARDVADVADDRRGGRGLDSVNCKKPVSLGGGVYDVTECMRKAGEMNILLVKGGYDSVVLETVPKK